MGQKLTCSSPADTVRFAPEGGLWAGALVAAARSQSKEAAIAAALTSAAERVESLTRKLNQTIGGSGVALG